MNVLLPGTDSALTETYAQHRMRFGALPDVDGTFIDVLAASGLAGRGGAAFPTARKWATVREHNRRGAVVLVNGAEGERASRKDQLLMTVRPHLIIDGALIAAQSVGAASIVVYVGGEHAALIARHGAAWFHNQGSGAPGTVMLTVSGCVRRQAVVEAAHGTTLATAIADAGGVTSSPHAVLLGGYFGTRLPAETAWPARLDAAELRAAGATLGCGVVHVLGASTCGVSATSGIISYLARESAGQCGPCVFGLHAVAATLQGVAHLQGREEDLLRLHRWAGMIEGRGACKHPDGAVALLRSALKVFTDEFSAHITYRCCTATALLDKAS